MLRTIKAVLFIAVVMTLAACNGLNNMGGRSVGAGDHSIQFVNNTGSQICYVYVSPSASTEWGADWLGDTGVVNNGESFTVRLPIAGTYDLMAVLESPGQGCDGNGQQITNPGFDIQGDKSWTVTTG